MYFVPCGDGHVQGLPAGDLYAQHPVCSTKINDTLADITLTAEISMSDCNRTSRLQVVGHPTAANHTAGTVTNDLQLDFDTADADCR